ncbi:hypothetical protein V5799_034031, partial [Amblyomma americanum]
QEQKNFLTVSIRSPCSPYIYDYEDDSDIPYCKELTLVQKRAILLAVQQCHNYYGDGLREDERLRFLGR